MDTDIFIYASLGIFIIAWVVFDVYIIVKKGKGSSISAHIIRNSKKYPVMVFGLTAPTFFLLGHLLWSMDSEDYMEPVEFKAKCERFLKKYGV